MLLDVQNSQESHSNQYDHQNTMQSIPEDYDEYKEESNPQYSMITNEGKFILSFILRFFEI